jgi:(p)ppGpp synthase/HD superfamily hydrolase
VPQLAAASPKKTAKGDGAALMGLTKRFDEALLFASRAHNGQVRKGTNVPYVAHVLSVAALVLEHGGSEDQAIAALLHDTVEDCRKK